MKLEDEDEPIGRISHCVRITQMRRSWFRNTHSRKKNARVDRDQHNFKLIYQKCLIIKTGTTWCLARRRCVVDFALVVSLELTQRSKSISTRLTQKTTKSSTSSAQLNQAKRAGDVTAVKKCTSLCRACQHSLAFALGRFSLVSLFFFFFFFFWVCCSGLSCARPSQTLVAATSSVWVVTCARLPMPKRHKSFRRECCPSMRAHASTLLDVRTDLQFRNANARHAPACLAIRLHCILM